MFSVTDAVTKNEVYIAPQHVVAVFEIVEGEHAGKTGVNLINGNIICTEEPLYIAEQVYND
jgi:hypothetical protein